MRPSHVVHTFWVGNLRLVLDVQVSCGNQLNNQRGMSGLTTQDINRCQTTARPRPEPARWSTTNGGAGTAARPTRQHAWRPSRAGRCCWRPWAAHSGGQTALYLTPLHGKASILQPLIANIHAALQHVRAVAEQFKTNNRWAVMLRCVSDRIAPTLGPFRPPTGLPATG